MSSLFLFGVGIIAFVIIRPVLEWIIDSKELDLSKEQKLTDWYK